MDKVIAETARKIEAGETVAPRRVVSLDHATWLVTLGEGFGKQQFRYGILNLVSEYFRITQLKSEVF